jgi:hypothetical protein
MTFHRMATAAMVPGIMVPDPSAKNVYVAFGMVAGCGGSGFPDFRTVESHTQVPTSAGGFVSLIGG